MKKLLTILCLTAFTLTTAHAQGGFQFANSVTGRIVFEGDGETRYLRNDDGVGFSVYYGVPDSGRADLALAPGILTIGSTPGVFADIPGIFTLPGVAHESPVSLQIRWSGGRALPGETAIIQTMTGPANGPGTPVWQRETGNLANRFRPIVVVLVPEPSTVAIGALAIGIVFLRQRNRRGRC